MGCGSSSASALPANKYATQPTPAGPQGPPGNEGPTRGPAPPPPDVLLRENTNLKNVIRQFEEKVALLEREKLGLLREKETLAKDNTVLEAQVESYKNSTSIKQGYVRIGDVAPDFTVGTQLGEISFHDYINGKWCVLFSHPADFTPVCTTELGRVALLRDEWEKRNCVVVGLSVDSVSSHKAWIQDINEVNKCQMWFPLVADVDSKIAVAYGMLDPTSLSPAVDGKTRTPAVTVRSVYVIDARKIIRLILTYPASTGRNFPEILRCIDSLQLTSYKKVATPADWNRGQDAVVVPSVSTEEAKKIFNKGIKEVKPYLRWTPDPSDENIPADLTGAPAALDCSRFAAEKKAADH